MAVSRRAPFCPHFHPLSTISFHFAPQLPSTLRPVDAGSTPGRRLVTAWSLPGRRLDPGNSGPGDGGAGRRRGREPGSGDGGAGSRRGREPAGGREAAWEVVERQTPGRSTGTSAATAAATAATISSSGRSTVATTAPKSPVLAQRGEQRRVAVCSPAPMAHRLQADRRRGPPGQSHQLGAADHFARAEPGEAHRRRHIGTDHPSPRWRRCRGHRALRPRPARTSASTTAGPGPMQRRPAARPDRATPSRRGSPPRQFRCAAGQRRARRAWRRPRPTSRPPGCCRAPRSGPSGGTTTAPDRASAGDHGSPPPCPRPPRRATAPLHAILTASRSAGQCQVRLPCLRHHLGGDHDPGVVPWRPCRAGQRHPLPRAMRSRLRRLQSRHAATLSQRCSPPRARHDVVDGIRWATAVLAGVIIIAGEHSPPGHRHGPLERDAHDVLQLDDRRRRHGEARRVHPRRRRRRCRPCPAPSRRRLVGTTDNGSNVALSTRAQLIGALPAPAQVIHHVVGGHRPGRPSSGFPPCWVTARNRR